MHSLSIASLFSRAARVAFAAVAIFAATSATDARAVSVSDTQWTVRPVLGGSFNIDGWGNQFILGADWMFNNVMPIEGLQIGPGLRLGMAGGFFDVNPFGQVKYNWNNLSVPVVPFVQGGLGLHVNTVGDVGLGLRFGGGFDYFVTPTIGVGSSLDFDVGGVLTNGARFAGMVQFVVGAIFKL